jgi:quercetin dioxygenase-like cupin family protein
MPVLTDSENERVDASIGEQRPPLEATITEPGDLAELRQRWSGLRAVPVLRASRSEGIDNSWGGLEIRTLLTGDQSAGRFAAHGIVLAPGTALPAHYHEAAHSVILVVDGELELGVGSVHENVEKHSLGFVPPMTRQSIENGSAEPATVVVVNSPAGSDRAYAAAHALSSTTAPADFEETLAAHGIKSDDRRLDNDALTNSDLPPLEFEFIGHNDLERLRAAFRARPGLPRLVRTTPEEFDADGTGTSRRKELINGDLSGGAAMLNLVSGRPGIGAPAHHQASEDEFFFITGGLLHMICATDSADLSAGGFAYCPRNCTHRFVNNSDSSTQFVTLNSPAGHERMMARVRQPMAEGDATSAELHTLAATGGFVFHDPEALGR